MILEFELSFARDVVLLIDDRLAQADLAEDGDADGSFDRADYMAGVGFAALQTYQTAVISRCGIKKRDALSLGPEHTSGFKMAALINAAANYWKHNAQWEKANPSDQAQQALDAFAALNVDPWREYALANALFAMVAPHRHRFASLLPFVERWRDEVLAMT